MSQERTNYDLINTMVENCCSYLQVEHDSNAVELVLKSYTKKEVTRELIIGVISGLIAAVIWEVWLKKIVEQKIAKKDLEKNIENECESIIREKIVDFAIDLKAPSNKHLSINLIKKTITKEIRNQRM